MKPLLRRIIVISAMAVLCLAPTACKPKAAGISTLTATVTGREIRAVIDGPAFIQPQADSAIVSTSNHKIAVERERILLDGAELAKLPAAAAKVEVRVAAGLLSVTADGEAVTTKQLSK
jgi:hypothetical protein